METNSAQNINSHFIPGGNRAFIPGRINYCFKFSGPSYSIDTACSSSLAAIHIACNSLWQGDVDCAIAGGTNILTNPDFTSGLDKGHFLSRTGNCKTFDETADGYCRGEGVGTVILKRLEDALLDNDPIQAVILNASTNHSAEAGSITRPFQGAQKAIFETVLDGTNPCDISYVEMHGTGTQAGDISEMSSVLDAFAPDSGQFQRLDNQKLFLGSAKANVGHGEAASGVTSLIKLLLMLRNDTIPPHCGIKTKINGKFPTNLAARGVHIANKPVKWDQLLQPRRAIINNFSAAGGNSALFVEDAPKAKTTEEDPRSSHLVAVSAKSHTSLVKNAQALLSFLRSDQGALSSLASLSYTTTARRIHHRHRICFTGSTIADIGDQLSIALDQKIELQRTQLRPAVAFAFSGQGAHYIGMGKALFDGIESFRSSILRYDFLGTSQGFPSIIPVISESAADITKMCSVSLQLATSCLQMALVKLWKSWGIVPNFVIGHSLGFYAALNAAGVLSEVDTIFLVGTRAQMLQDKCRPDTHLMLAANSTLAALTSSIRDAAVEVDVACINSNFDIVLSGKRLDIEKLQRLLKSQNIKAAILRVPYAFHSSQVDCLLEEFKMASRGIAFEKPLIPLVCPTESTVVRENGVFGPKYLADHCRKCVDMVGALDAATTDGVLVDGTVLLEIGPQATLCGMLKAVLHSRCKILPSLGKSDRTWKALTNALSAFYSTGFQIDWEEYHRDFVSCHKVLSLPAYGWDLKDYWIRYVNDWSLRKGDPIPESHMVQTTDSARKKLDIKSATIHEVIEEEIFDQNGSFAILCDLRRSDINRLVQGHKVNGIPLCTPSVYADIAFSVGTYLRDQYLSIGPQQHIDISNLTIEKALVIKSSGKQLLRASFQLDCFRREVECQFSIVDIDGDVLSTHATCVVKFVHAPDLQWLRARSAESNLQILELRKGFEIGESYKFSKSMIYRMVGTLAEFDVEYRGLEEIVLNSNSMEAFGIIKFSNIKPLDEDSFHIHPACIDAFTQTAGFVMNANENSNPNVEVFVNHGWTSLRVFEKLSSTKTYLSYVKMVCVQGRLWEGDLTVLEGENVVMMFGGLKLQGVPKRLLHSILQSASRDQLRTKDQDDMPGAIIEKQLKLAPDITPPRAPAKVVSEYLTQTIINGASMEKEQTSNGSSTLVNIPNTSSSVYLSNVLRIVSEESGFGIEELADAVVLAEIGIDSLLSLIIASRLKEEVGFDMGSGVLLFDEFATIGDLKNGVARALGSLDTSDTNGFSPTVDLPMTPNQISPSSSSETHMARPIENASPPSLDTPASKSKPTSEFKPRASSVILQEFSQVAPHHRILFLFPDGSGAATSYANMPHIHENLKLIGLNCPYIRDPSRMQQAPLDNLIALYLTEIRKHQKKGPYSLGGWSTGGILAYLATQQLFASNEEVEHLLLIDSPVPKGLDRLPQRFYDHCSESGIFGQMTQHVRSQQQQQRESIPMTPTTPKWLIPHFNATIDLLHNYYAKPLTPSANAQYDLQVSIYWAGESAFDGIKFPKLPAHADDNEGMKFLSERRRDFSAGEWDDLFPASQIVVVVDKGADHFSMMYGEKAKNLAKFIDRATRT